MWGWLDSLFGGLESVWQALTNLPSLIWGFFESAFSSITGWLSSLFQAISNLPSLILEGIKSIFVPDMEEMKAEFASFVDKVNPSTMDSSSGSLGGILDSPEREPTDFTANLNLGNSIMGTLNFNGIALADLDKMKEAVVFFRPIINGFIAWLLAMFYYRELLSFIGQSPNMAQARATAGEHRAEQSKASKNKG